MKFTRRYLYLYWYLGIIYVGESLQLFKFWFIYTEYTHTWLFMPFIYQLRKHITMNNPSLLKYTIHLFSVSNTCSIFFILCFYYLYIHLHSYVGVTFLFFLYELVFHNTVWSVTYMRANHVWPRKSVKLFFLVGTLYIFFLLFSSVLLFYFISSYSIYLFIHFFTSVIDPEFLFKTFSINYINWNLISIHCWLFIFKLSNDKQMARIFLMLTARI